MTDEVKKNVKVKEKMILSVLLNIEAFTIIINTK